MYTCVRIVNGAAIFGDREKRSARRHKIERGVDASTPRFIISRGNCTIVVIDNDDAYSSFDMGSPPMWKVPTLDSVPEPPGAK